MEAERRDIKGRAAVVQRVIDGIVQNPSVTLTVNTLQQWLGVPVDAATRILERLASSGLVREVQKGVWSMRVGCLQQLPQAVLEFVDFMAKYPRHPLAANAQYWIGEAYYVQRDYRQALTEFQKVPHVVAESPKVPDALLKVGLCYRNLRDESRARQTWDRVVKDYPKSQAAGHAGALLRGKAAAAAR